ncbi:MAG: hypothetical protein GX550_07115 [Syntrophomonadaceae bacterium]|nr:hypothetical protein [Syntrophomonadaceae bacterium]
MHWGTSVYAILEEAVKIQEAFLALICIAFITTTIFGILVYRQTGKLQKTALEAKQRQEELIRKMEEQTEGQDMKQGIPEVSNTDEI